MERALTQTLVINGEEGARILAPYMVAQDATVEYRLYDIDYDELKRQLKIYKSIYLFGQLMHGAVLVKLRVK